jgi:hypothetical protein
LKQSEPEVVAARKRLQAALESIKERRLKPNKAIDGD